MASVNRQVNGLVASVLICGWNSGYCTYKWTCWCIYVDGLVYTYTDKLACYSTYMGGLRTSVR